MLTLMMILAFTIGGYYKGSQDQLKQDKLVIDVLLKCNKTCKNEVKNEKSSM